MFDLTSNLFSASLLCSELHLTCQSPAQLCPGDTETSFPGPSLPSLLQDESRFCTCRPELVRNQQTPPLGAHCQQQAIIHTTSKAKYSFSFSITWAPGASPAAQWMQWWPWQSCCFLPKPEQSTKKLCWTLLLPPGRGQCQAVSAPAGPQILQRRKTESLFRFNCWTVVKLKDWMENGSKWGYSSASWPTVLGAAWKNCDGQNFHQQIMCFWSPTTPTWRLL